MNRKSHGVFSLILLGIALIMGIVSVMSDSPAIGSVLAIDLILFFVLVPKQVCGKCPVREECAHVIMGKISIRLSLYCGAAYGLSDLIVLASLMLPLIIVPQFWLIRHPVAIALFWAITAVSAADILMFVCPSCGNMKCPFNKGFKRA